MKAQIIQIGNSQGIRIPKMLLEETKMSGEVDIISHPDGILIRKTSKPRDGWAESFRAMAENDDDELVETPQSGSFEKKEWTW